MRGINFFFFFCFLNHYRAGFLYVSDRNSLFTISNLHDRDVTFRQIASIDHSFVMHDLSARIDVDWMIMESYSSASGDGRGLYQGHIYNHDAKLVCSFMQDGVLTVDNGGNSSVVNPETVNKLLEIAKPNDKSKI